MRCSCFRPALCLGKYVFVFSHFSAAEAEQFCVQNCTGNATETSGAWRRAADGTKLPGTGEKLVDFAISGNHTLVQCHGKPTYLVAIENPQEPTRQL